MARLRAFCVLAWVCAACGGAPATPPDFTLKIKLYDARAEPQATAQLVVLDRLGYQFLNEAPTEVVVIDLEARRVTLLDLKRAVRCDLNFDAIDDALARQRAEGLEEVKRLEAAGKRAGRVEAAIRRDLLEPKFEASYEAASHLLTLKSPAVEVGARGEPDADGARLALVGGMLQALGKLGAWRDPELLPVFSRLDALKALTEGRRLRPTELDFLYRLTGPPQRLRWTYELVPDVSARERSALEKVRLMAARSRVVPYERYDEPRAD